MSSPLPQVDFSRIRPHESSRQRAWEELSFHLVPDIENLPAGTNLERRTSPDGGIEFSCPAPPDRSHAGEGLWAWQAKYLFALTASAFAQMTKSVESALASTPDLVRYTFILPTDRSGARPRRGKSGLQRWHDHVETWQTKAAARGLNVEFDYIGHSRVLSALQAEKHAGTLRYYFDATLFTGDFFRRQVEREIHNLGDRYDPSVHVELEIAELFDALCRSPGYAQRLAETREEISRHATLCDAAHGPTDQRLAAAAEHTERTARDLVAALRAAEARITSPDPSVLAELKSATRTCSDQLMLVNTRLQQLLADCASAAAKPAAPPQDQRRTATPPLEPAARNTTRSLYEFEARCRSLGRALDRALDLVAGPKATAAQRAALVVKGSAGCGKSHLVADVARSRASRGMPTLLILGQNLDDGPLWPQIARELGLDLTSPDLLHALEAAARIRRSGRALIIVDAINEGGGADLWQKRLAGFLEDISQHPWIALALTVRDTYADELIPANLAQDAIASVTHQGLIDHEEEALTRYAQHYGIRLPDVPLLLPELSNPLFLRSLCRSVKERGLSAIPRQAQGLSWVFHGLIDAVNRSLATRLDLDPNDPLVHRAVQQLAGALLDAGTEALPLQRAKEICGQLHSETRHSRTLLTGLLNEGLLLLERTRPPAGDPAAPREQVRFTYQLLADHLRAEAILGRSPTNELLAAAIIGLATGDHAWSRIGLIEALVLLVPERRGMELADLMQQAFKRGRAKPSTRRAGPLSKMTREWLDFHFARSFCSALLWRTPRSITPRTLALAKFYRQQERIGAAEWLSLRLTLACVPDHPLNVNQLDETLRRLPLPKRDLLWSASLFDIWTDEPNPITRTIEWAWSGPGEPPADVARLASTLLAWFLTSPNRRLRDCAAKALLRLMEHRTRLLVELLDRFSSVNDPYVEERLLAVACGHALRHRFLAPADDLLDDLADLGRRAFDRAFTDQAVPEHLLVRHYARTCAEVVAQTLARHGRRFDRDLALARPPHRSSWPLAAPRLRTLAHGFGVARKDCSSVASLLGDDFQRYTLADGIAEDFVLPDQRRRRTARRRIERRRLLQLRQAIGSAAGSTLLQEVDRLLAAEDSFHLYPYLDELAADGGFRVRLRWGELATEFPAQADNLQAVEQVAHDLRRDDDRPVHPNPDLLGRWICRRVLELGWTAESFARLDSRLWDARAYGSSETERFGKKYVWIAFQQMLGHLADHCPLRPESRDEGSEAYAGPWQVSHALDLDPTVSLRGDEPPAGTTGARLRAPRIGRERGPAWWLAASDHTLKLGGTGEEWLRDAEDVPQPEGLLAVRDPTGCEWLVLASHARWRSSIGHPDTDHRHLWIMTQANLVRQQHVQQLGRWAAEQDWMGRWMPEPADHLTGLLGAHPDLAPWCGEGSSSAPPDWVDVGRRGGRTLPCPLMIATGAYRRPSDRDFSAVGCPGAVLPAPLLLSLLQARWAGADSAPARDLGLGPLETEYSWLAAGKLVAFATGATRYETASQLYVRAQELRHALAAAGLALWSWILGEKIYWSGPHTPSNERTYISGAVALAPAVTLWRLTVEHVHREGSGTTQRRTLLPHRTSTPLYPRKSSRPRSA